MEARDYLLRAWRVDARILRRVEERQRMIELLRTVSGHEGRQSDEARREAEAAVAELEREIDREILGLCRAKRDLRGAIDAVRDERCRQLLEMRYRHYLSWRDIADEMGVDVRHVYRLHQQALESVARSGIV